MTLAATVGVTTNCPPRRQLGSSSLPQRTRILLALDSELARERDWRQSIPGECCGACRTWISGPNIAMSLYAHLLVVLAVLGSSLSLSGSPPETPCPAVFAYSYSPSQGWHGVVTIAPPLIFSEVQLAVRLSVALYRPDAPVGKIEVLGGATEVQNIANRASKRQKQRIQYLVIFPPYDDLPRISSVKINGVEFCSSPSYNDARGVIDLKYTLKTGLELAISNGNEFSVYGGSSSVPEQTVPTYQTQPPQQTWQQQPQLPQQPQETWQQPQPQQPQQTWPQQQPQQPSRPVEAPSPMRPPIPRPTQGTTTATTPDEYADYEEDDVASQYEVNSVECGRPAFAQVNTLVVKGEETRRGEWPWMASLYTTYNNDFRCAGSLISRRHVITAAHCITDSTTQRPMAPSAISVQLGRYNLSSVESYTQVMEVAHIYVNPKYAKSKKRDYDVGLIVFTTAATINNYVRTVCLWDNTFDTSQDFVIDKVGMAPGWGKDEQGLMGRDMKLARMPVVRHSKCVASDDDFFNAFTSDKTFCAGFANGTSLCNGDSGGGLYFYRDNPVYHKMAWFVRGIVSLSKPDQTQLTQCGDRNYVVFTDIPKVFTWVGSKLAPPKR